MNLACRYCAAGLACILGMTRDTFMCPQCLRYFVIIKPGGAFYNEINVSRDCPIRAQAASPGICMECNRSNRVVEEWKCEELGGAQHDT